MAPNFEFTAAARIIFGCGRLVQIGEVATDFGKHVLLVTGRDPSRAGQLIRHLSAKSLPVTSLQVAGEPDLDTVRAGVLIAKENGCDLVISFGGGSALDAAKAIAAMVPQDGEILDYVEIIGRGKALSRPSLPFIAIPTTAGTGSEVTRNAVIASPEHRVKVSLRSGSMLPKVALVDPELTRNLPAALTASTGLDALTQCIEPYVSCRANPLTDAFCVDGMRLAARSLKRAVETGDMSARVDMALASLYGGLALANAGLGVVHGFAGPIGGMFPAPHGAVCAALLPSGMEVNVRALQARAPESESLKRYAEIGRIVTGNPQAGPREAVEWTRNLASALSIPRLRAYGIRLENAEQLVEKAARASSTKGNPIQLTETELGEILAAAL